MKPLLHSKQSVRRYGGHWSDYIKIHDFLDSSKAHVPDMRHRAVFHHSFGIYVAEMTLGEVFQNSEGRDISTRDIAEEHILEDCGFIPTVHHWLDGMPHYEWMGGKPRKTTIISMVD